MLIHKTMKMPTSCLSCWISPTCEVWVREKSKHKGYDNRLDECPLEEVVRCKDCRFYVEDINCFVCVNGNLDAKPTDYCSWAERKDNGKAD